MARRKKITHASESNSGHFLSGNDNRRTERMGSLPSELAEKLDSQYPGASDETRRLVRDLVRRNRGLSGVGKLCARLAACWQQVAVVKLAEGDPEAAAKASREAETFLRRISGELDRAEKQRPPTQAEKSGSRQSGQREDSSDASLDAEAAVLLESLKKRAQAPQAAPLEEEEPPDAVRPEKPSERPPGPSVEGST